MVYPRLIFKNEKTSAVSPADTVTDLKLDLLLSEEVTRFLILKPDRDTLLARREMFDALLKDETAPKKVAALKDALGKASALYKAHNTTLSDKGAAYIFVSLFAQFTVFCRLASEMGGYGELFSRFSAVFSQIVDSEDFLSAESELPALQDEMASVSGIVLKAEGENTKVMRDTEKNMADELRDCARELGIPLREKTDPPIELQKDVLDAAGKLYPAQFAKAEAFLDKYRTVISGEIFDYFEELTFIDGILQFTLTASKKGIPYSFQVFPIKRSLISKMYTI